MRVGVIMYETSLTKGQELVAQRMVREFRKQGEDAVLITSVFHDQERVTSDDDLDRLGGYVYSFDEKLGIPVARVRSRKENWPPRRITFVDFMSNLAKIVEALNLDVLISHSTLWNGPEDAAKFVEWRRNKAKGGAPITPLVFCHMSHFQEPSDERYDLEERTFREAWNSTSLLTIMNTADMVLVTTPYEKEQMKKMGVQEEKFFLFPGGIDTPIQGSERVDIRKKYSLPENTKLVTYLGTVEQRKNVANVIKIAELLDNRPDLYFVIGGKPDGDYGKGVKTASDEQINASMLGPVPEEDYPALIKESYLNLNMSRSEALGLVQLEFMLNGVPVVTSGVGGQSWIVKDGTNGVVLEGPDDVKGAAEAISKLADSKKLRDRLGGNARENASQFTMPSLVAELRKSIEPRLERGSGLPEIFEPGEKIVEAWVKKGYRVAVTSRKLIIDSTKGGERAVIPFSDITQITRRLKFRWWVLLAGVGATMGLYTAELLDPTGSEALGSLLTSWMSFFPYGLGGVIALELATLPLVFCIFLAVHSAKKGFTVAYGEKREAFIPAEFSKALRMAEQLVPGKAKQTDFVK